jgi:hypothetical protein
VPKLYIVTYPRNFQIRNVDALVQRTAMLLSLGLGDEANYRFLQDMFEALYPREDQEVIDGLVMAATTALAQASMALAAPLPGDPNAPPAGDVIPEATSADQLKARDRALKILKRAGLLPEGEAPPSPDQQAVNQ